ncbi:MAG: AmmeMemoRadiSam system radical SAM enzyme [Candidatus Margulisiibacteriota bacterium]
MKEALFFTKLLQDQVRCDLCAHRCVITPGRFGICGVRENRAGALVTHAYGRTVAEHVDPIEKKPLYHFLPGTQTYSIATIGCNFRCGFCQNWQISQQNFKQGSPPEGTESTPEAIVDRALQSGCASIAYTYTEPTIFFEYAYDTALLAKSHNLANVFVTNGYMTQEALDCIAPYLDACNVDLKAFSGSFYNKTCKAQLQPVLDTIREIHRKKIWLELTTLIIPGENDSVEELTQLTRFIADIDPHIPWHISRFFPKYQFHDHPVTPISTLDIAQEIGQKAGLRNIHLGNVR